MAEEEHATAGLSQALQGLTVKDFQEFKTKLLEVQVEGGWNIPEDLLEKATQPCTLVSCTGKSLGDDAATDLALGLLEEMNQRDLAEELLHEKVKEYKQKYREHVVQKFLWYEEVNSCPGEKLSVSSRYATLSIARKPWRKPGGEQGAVASSHGGANASNGAATTMVTAQTLFKPTQAGQTPQVVVLVGAPGMGKTMTVRKVMVEWAEGILYKQFDYIFCIDCKELTLSEEVSVVDLVSKCCPHRRAPGKILDDQKKILFIFDGFEALGFSLTQPKDELSSDPREAKPLETIVMSLLKKTVLPESSLLITTRPTALRSLGRCLEGECQAEILGFAAASRQEFFHRYFENNNKAAVAFRFARGDEVLYSLCAIPVVSWTVCTMLEGELCLKQNLLECSKTTTQVTMSYLSWLMKCRGRDNPQDLQRFLLRLCSLAADGIWKHKVQFEGKEIEERGLDQPDLLPLFLNEKTSKKGGDHGNVYSFPHLHLQEFFAAMFYVLEGEEEAVDGAGALRRDLNVVLESYSKSRKDLNFMVRFLFGLESPKSIEYAAEAIGCRIAPQARGDMLRWLQGRQGGTSHPGQLLKVSELDTFHFLFEMNEKSFTQSALGGFTDIDLQNIKLSLYDQLALCFCIRQWDELACVTLRGCSFELQDPKEEVPQSGASGDGEHPCPREEPHAPIQLLCRALQHPGSQLQVLRLRWCRLAESCCAELGVLLAQHPRLAQLELGDGALGDAGVKLLCQGLRQPSCRLRVLRLRYSSLTSACCQDFAAVLASSPRLEELDLSFSEGLRDAGLHLLCQGLRHPGCRLRTLRLGSCRLTGACCQDLAAGLVDNPHLTCLDLSDNELGSDGVLQLCQQLQHPSCQLQVLGLSTSELDEEVLQELAALRTLKPNLKVKDLLEQDTPETGAMARLPFHRGVLPGGRKGLPSSRRAPHLQERSKPSEVSFNRGPHL
ncbi:NACHT, LRR and PYD domains-containing protein 12-like [Melanerpes formicivorus]|uniref:NACHT, LRR and PYD domains-containing protein 12-like n=1 Tax=Melanerpes formicivorus TaxID=211600 RepID=UPI003590051F